MGFQANIYWRCLHGVHPGFKKKKKHMGQEDVRFEILVELSKKYERYE